MKTNILYSIVITMALLLSGCSDFLDTQSPSSQSMEQVFENQGMARSALMGVYSNLANTYVYGQKMSVNWQGVSDIEQASGFQTNPSIQLTSDAGAANFYSDWYNKTIVWEYIYKMAENASTVVEGIRNSKLFKEGNATMRIYLGEALTLRSLAYFELTRRWGDIPYKESTSNSDLSNVYISKTSRDSIYACLVRDMLEAVDYLPWLGTNSDLNCERITKGFAKGLLARIALFAGGWSIRDGNQFPDDSEVEHYPNPDEGMAEMNGYYVGRSKNWQYYYNVAKQQCAEIIGSSENPHGLDPDYGNIWKTVCGLNYNQYNENMFEVANGVAYSGDIGTLMGRSMDGNIGYGQRGFGGSYVSTNAYYFYSFSPTDSRRDYSCYFPRYQRDSEDNRNKEKMAFNESSVFLGKWCFFWTHEKYRIAVSTATSRVATGINWILMRYSDVLLMFAEAAYILDNDADKTDAVAGISPREALEIVRTRAFPDDLAEVSNYDPDFFEAIINERAWEFGGEGIRKLDLIRWGLLDKKIEIMKEAMLRILDHKDPVKCFDKVYQPDELPSVLYYKYQDDGEYIDLSSCNFYKELDMNPDPEVYKSITWIRNNPSASNIVSKSVNILTCATGLRAYYDYSQILSTLTYGAEIEEQLLQQKIGNGVCNYRHPYSIYYNDIYKSNGYLKNSYGFDHSTTE